MSGRLDRIDRAVRSAVEEQLRIENGLAVKPLEATAASDGVREAAYEFLEPPHFRPARTVRVTVELR